MKFTASLDRTAKLLTLVVSCLLVAVLVGSARTVVQQYTHAGTLSIAGIIGIASTTVVLFLAIAYAPQGYRLTSQTFVIRRRLSSKRIAYSQIAKAYRIVSSEMDPPLRILGVGGYLGYFGKYNNNRLGAFLLYATQRRNYVGIELTDGTTLVVTPDDLSLAEELQNHLP